MLNRKSLLTLLYIILSEALFSAMTAIKIKKIFWLTELGTSSLNLYFIQRIKYVIKLLSLTSTRALCDAGLELYKLHFSLLRWLPVRFHHQYHVSEEIRMKAGGRRDALLACLLSASAPPWSGFQSPARTDRTSPTALPQKYWLAPAWWSPCFELEGSDNPDLFLLFHLPQCLFAFLVS